MKLRTEKQFNKINETKSSSFEKTNKIDLTRVTRKKREDRNERENITIDFVYIQKGMREYCEQLWTKFDKLNRPILQKAKTTNITQGETANLNSP